MITLHDQPSIGQALAVQYTLEEGYDWLADRATYIGASDAAAVLGLGHFHGPYAVWARKVGIYAGDDETPVMRRGRALEPWILGEYERQNSTVAVVPWVLQHPRFPMLRTNLDGWSDGMPIEAKAAHWTDRDDVADLVEGNMPLPGSKLGQYWVQVQFQMAITGATEARLVVAIDADVTPIPIARDEAFIAHLERSCVAFWRRHVLAEVPPPANELDLEALRETLRPRRVDVELEADNRVAYLLECYDRASAALAKWQARKDKARAQLQQHLAAADARQARIVLPDGSSRKAGWYGGGERVDITALRRERPELVEPYLTTARPSFRVY